LKNCTGCRCCPGHTEFNKQQRAAGSGICFKINGIALPLRIVTGKRYQQYTEPEYTWNAIPGPEPHLFGIFI